jgi:hypothetical protein
MASTKVGYTALNKISVWKRGGVEEVEIVQASMEDLDTSEVWHRMSIVWVTKPIQLTLAS